MTMVRNVLPLSTVDPPISASVFDGQSIHCLLFKPLYNGHLFLSQRWPLRKSLAVHRILIEGVRDLTLNILKPVL